MSIIPMTVDRIVADGYTKFITRQLVDCNPLIPLLLFVLDLLYKLFLHCCAVGLVGKTLTDTRGNSERVGPAFWTFSTCTGCLFLRI